MRFTLAALVLSLVIRQSPTQVSTATIAGVVLFAESTDPIPRAQVSLVKVSGPTGAQIQNDPLLPTTQSDGSGRFSLKDVSPGTYRFYAARNGYTRAEYGQRSVGGIGAVVTLTAGQTMNNVVFHLTPAATVSGRIKDATGEALADVTVDLLRVAYDSTGKRTLRPAFAARTNDRGEYRLYWVTPGRYYLDVNAGRTAIDEGLVSASQDAFRLANQPGPTQQGSRDTFAVAALLNNNLTVSREGYVASYYPGTTDVAQATEIDVKPGAEINGVDVLVTRQPTARLRGRILNLAGEPAATANVVLLSGARDGDTIGTASIRNSSSGAFEIRDAPPGTYLLRATLVTQAPAAGRGATDLATAVATAQAQIASIAAGTTPPSPAEARMQIIVTGTDLDNIVLSARQGSSVPGRVRVDGAAAITDVMGYDRMSVVLQPANDLTPGPPRQARFKSDGSFVVEGVFPGEYRVRVDGRPMNVFMKEVHLGSTDLMPDILKVAESSPGELDVLLSQKAGQLAGTLADKDSKPANGAQIILIPTDFRGRRELYRTATTDGSGHFTLTAVTPGEYKVFSWEELEPFSYYDADMIKHYESQGERVRITESGTSNVTATIIPQPR